MLYLYQRKQTCLKKSVQGHVRTDFRECPHHLDSHYNAMNVKVTQGHTVGQSSSRPRPEAADNTARRGPRPPGDRCRHSARTGLLLGVVAARQLVVVYAVKQLLAAQALGHHASRPRWLGPRSCLRIAIKNTMREA